MSILETVLSHETVVPMEKLTEITVTEDTNCLELDMTGNRWAEFNFVVLRLHTADDSDGVFSGFVNDGAGSATYNSLSNPSDGTSGYFCYGSWNHDILALYFVSHGCSGGLRGLVLANELLYSRIRIALPQIQTLRFGSPSTATLGLKAGSTLEVWGVM